MAVKLDYLPGATPLDADELACLIPKHITTQGELNEWEQLNIEQGETWSRRWRKDMLNEAFARQLHKEMFGETWSWAGSFRKSDKNIGVEWQHVSVQLRNLLDDVRYQIDHATYPPDEIAARFHHRLVAIHPFPNGNGRHARMMADFLIQKLGQPRFTWGSKSLTEATEARISYIDALRAADRGNIQPLLAFVRS
jgi:Fic-DOC domain mobile mystery protein B